MSSETTEQERSAARAALLRVGQDAYRRMMADKDEAELARTVNVDQHTAEEKTLMLFGVMAMRCGFLQTKLALHEQMLRQVVQTIDGVVESFPTNKQTR